MTSTVSHARLIEEFAGCLARDSKRAVELFADDAQLDVRRGDWSVTLRGHAEIGEFLERLPTALVFHVVAHGGDDSPHRVGVEVIGEKRGLIRERWQYTVRDGRLQSLSVTES